MIQISNSRIHKIAPFFEAYRWNYLANAVLEGQMGRMLADDSDDPHIAALEVTNLHLYVVGGDPSHPSARRFVQDLGGNTALIFVSDGWRTHLEAIHPGKFIELTRYAFTSGKLKTDRLRTLAAAIPTGYSMVRMDLALAEKLAVEQSDFSVDHMVNFESPRGFIERGFGYCILAEREIVCAATTFAICSRGIEIQINTREGHQGVGLATAAAAQLLLHSLENGLDPNWDTANKISAGLAKKLGYTPQGSYPMFVVLG